MIRLNLLVTLLVFFRLFYSSSVMKHSSAVRYSYIESYSTELIVGSTGKQALLETPGEVNCFNTEFFLVTFLKSKILIAVVPLSKIRFFP